MTELSRGKSTPKIGVRSVCDLEHFRSSVPTAVSDGKSIPTDRPSRYLGLVQSHDDKPKWRLHEVLKDQGWQENQPVTFMTDGGDTVINMARYMAPTSEHILDWFHITMRITV